MYVLIENFKFENDERNEIIFTSKYYFLVLIYFYYITFCYEPGAWLYYSYKIESI